MAGDFPYYLDSRRGAIPEWSADKFAMMSWGGWLTFDALSIAKKIKTPTLMIHSDDAALPDNAKNFFADISAGNKILFWTEGTQSDFYDQPKQVAESVAAITVFFKGQVSYVNRFHSFQFIILNFINEENTLMPFDFLCGKISNL